MPLKKLLAVQVFLLLCGSLFAWYNTVKNFIRFFNIEGTIFKVYNCAIPNPVTEPCFYGAVAFVIAFAWAVVIYKQKEILIKQQNYLWWFLSAGTIFAWFNVTREFLAFYGPRSGPALGCSAQLITNPFLTPCFTGASIFLISAILAGIIYSLASKKATINP